MRETEGILHSLLEKYSLVDKDLNYLLATEPLGNKEGTLLNNVFKFIKNHPKQWGFYFVERVWYYYLIGIL